MNKRIASYILFASTIISLALSATVQGDNKDVQGVSEQKMLIDSLKKFVDDKPEAADEMEYVIQKKEDVARQKMDDMLKKIATDTSSKNNQEDLEGGDIDYVTRKLNLALCYFYEAKYWLTLSECNNVIRIAPKNVTAWIRRGSANYMLGNYQQAKDDWTYVLTLNPNKRDKHDVEKFLAKAEQLVASNGDED